MFNSYLYRAVLTVGFESFLQSCNIMRVVYRGGQVGGGRGRWWEWVGGQVEGRFSLPLGHQQWCCPLSKWQICAQPIGWVKMNIVSSLIQQQYWLVLPSGPTGPVMHSCGFTGLAKSHLWKQTYHAASLVVIPASCLPGREIWSCLQTTQAPMDARQACEWGLSKSRPLNLW